MAPDPLKRLLSVRRLVVDATIRTLAERLSTETAAAEVVAAINSAVPVQRAAADARPETAEGRDRYAAWATWAGARRVAGTAALAAARTQTEAARADLAAAQAASRAVGELIALRAEAARALARRQEAHALDDVARSLRHARGNSRSGSGQ